MIAISALPWVMLGKKNALTRANGFVLLASYAGYLAYLLMRGAV
jgi:hypothetical protein